MEKEIKIENQANEIESLKAENESLKLRVAFYEGAWLDADKKLKSAMEQLAAINLLSTELYKKFTAQ